MSSIVRRGTHERAMLRWSLVERFAKVNHASFPYCYTSTECTESTALLTPASSSSSSNVQRSNTQSQAGPKQPRKTGCIALSHCNTRGLCIALQYYRTTLLIEGSASHHNEGFCIALHNIIGVCIARHKRALHTNTAFYRLGWPTVQVLYPGHERNGARFSKYRQACIPAL